MVIAQKVLNNAIYPVFQSDSFYDNSSIENERSYSELQTQVK